MANHLKMAKVQAIQALAEQGWSIRRIARELGIDRETVARNLRLTRGQALPEGPGSPPNPAKVITGSQAVAESAQGITLDRFAGGRSLQRRVKGHRGTGEPQPV